MIIQDKNRLKEKNYIKNILRDNGSENPELEFRLIEELMADSGKIGIEVDIIRYLELKKPMQYLAGYTYVKNKKVIVGENTLIPGPEMDQVIDICNGYIKPGFKVVELCTGCGGIAVLLGEFNKEATIYATDISSGALEIAEKNVQLYHLNNVNLLKGDLFQPLNEANILSVNVIFSNPPYCKTKEIDLLPAHLKVHTPRLAINGGSDGLEFYRSIINEAHKYMKSEGFIIFQHDDGQSLTIGQLLNENGFRVVERIKNYAGKEVFIIGYLHNQ